MKYLLLFLFASGLSLNLNAQITPLTDLSRHTKNVWNDAEQEWENLEERTWKYDANGKVVSYTHLFEKDADSLPRPNIIIENKYDGQGRLILSVSTSTINSPLGPAQWVSLQRVFRLEISYAQNGRKKEEISLLKDYYDPVFVPQYKHTYGIDGIGNRHWRKIYGWDRFTGQFFMEVERDTLFNENGCPGELNFYEYYLGALQWTTRHTRKFNEDCTFQFEEKARKTAPDSVFIPILRYEYDYSGDRLQLYTNTQEYQGPNGWRITEESWYDYQDYGNERKAIRMEYHRYRINASAIDTTTTLSIINYDRDGNPLSHYSYLNAIPNHFDSTTYTYDEAHNVVRRNRTIEYFLTGGTIAQTYYFAHFCDGRVKTEIQDELPNVFHYSFEYIEGADCEIKEGEESLTIFPNPNNGKFEIESNILANEDAVIRIFSVSGREVYSQKVRELAESKSLDIEHLLPGSYYVVVHAGELYAGKRIIIADR